MNSILVQLGRILANYTMGQRVVIISVLIGVLSAAVSMVFWANRPEYDILFTDLDPSNASMIVSDLRSMKTKFKIENSGRDIFVPRDQVAELRLKFSEAGYANEAITGYEIFDDSKIGMTTFMQQLNMRRALEGELAKTINQFPEVKNTRVHIVLPEDKLFEKDKKGTASIVLYMKAGHYIGDDQINGITALVANSIKGIEPENVVVVDSDGNLLSNGTKDENLLGASGTQWDLKHREELKLQQKVKEIVENVVGVNNAVVKVSVDMNFEQIERNTEIPDPDNVVVVSEESHIESSSNLDSLNNSNAQKENENILTNYEIGWIKEHYIGNTGVINKLSVAVLVNGRKTFTTDANGNETIEIVTRDNRELGQIAALVRSAVGFDQERGDVVEVQNINFDTSSTEEDKRYFAEAEKKELWANVINKAMLVIGLIVAFVFIKSLLKSSGEAFNITPIIGTSGAGRANLPGGGVNGNEPKMISVTQADGTVVQQPILSESEEELAADLFIKKLSPEAQARLRAKDTMMNAVKEYAKDEPEASAKIIRSWLTKENA